MKTNQIYVGFSRPLQESLRYFISRIADVLREGGYAVTFPRSSPKASDAVPEDGFWPRKDIIRCRSALFVFDQNGDGYDAMVQLGHVLAAGVSASCIMVRRSVCASPVPTLIKAYGLTIEEVQGAYFSAHLLQKFLSWKRG